jgi:hypothetical protein
MTRAGIAIVTLASLAVATAVTGFALTRANATDGAQPNTACATTAACIEGDNTSNGPGVKGTSTKGHGVVGTTKAKGASVGTSHAGVLGQDLQTGGGALNAGVEGTSTNGTGIHGLSTNNAAVFGESTISVGVEGTGEVGVEGAGANEGVFGFSNPTGDSFLAEGEGGNLFRGVGTNSLDAFIVDNLGNTSVGNNLTAAGAVSSAGTGTFGSQITGNFGVEGLSDAEGVVGENYTTGDAILANGFGGLLIRGNNSRSTDVFEVDDNGDVFAVSYNFLAEATKLQHTSMGTTVKTYSSQAAQPTLEDDGEAQLVNGLARVPLDPAFASTIDRSGYMVMVTPEGLTRGVLCVVQRTMSGFVVQENMGGHSSVPFSYRIVGKPYGSTAPRLPLATVPGHFGRVVPKIHLEARTFKPSHHARLALKLVTLHN